MTDTNSQDSQKAVPYGNRNLQRPTAQANWSLLAIQALVDCLVSRKCPHPEIFGQHKLDSIGYLKEKGGHEVWDG